MYLQCYEHLFLFPILVTKTLVITTETVSSLLSKITFSISIHIENSSHYPYHINCTLRCKMFSFFSEMNPTKKSPKICESINTLEHFLLTLFLLTLYFNPPSADSITLYSPLYRYWNAFKFQLYLPFILFEITTNTE